MREETSLIRSTSLLSSTPEPTRRRPENSFVVNAVISRHGLIDVVEQGRQNQHAMGRDSRPGAETVGARLRRLRIERGLSQRDLSAPGITYAYISRIEAGARTPSMKALRMLARKLGVTPEYL